ncbi:MAG: hypothetical protein M3Y35_15640 [Actinomycetota bacterium]|nr:hypothetical protein [Actinomycetota bacterium]
MDSRNRYWAALADPEVTRLTGTHAIFEPVGVESWLRTRRDHHDRADWAILRLQDLPSSVAAVALKSPTWWSTTP